MIVDKTHKVIYLHNPKCGGTFLRRIYIEKYGETEATDWWLEHTYTYGTDLGHIIYRDLSRFVPDFREYRLLVMVRNPYNRFISGFKESKNHHDFLRQEGIVKYYNYFFRYYRCNRLSRLENMYENIREVLSFSFVCRLRQMLLLSASDFSEKLCASGKNEQDRFLRNKRVPWLYSQSAFTGPGVTVLSYESVSDWHILLEAFDLMEFSDRLSIAKDYGMDDALCRRIEQLYPEDKFLNSIYGK